MRESLGLTLLAAAAFSGTLWAPFHLDDFALLADPAITAPTGWIDCWRLTQTRPLTWFSFWLNYSLSGPNPTPFHLFNLLLHLASTLLVRSSLSRLLNPNAALLAAGIFALHPIQAEPVVYIFARATLLMALFCLLSLRAWAAGQPWIAAAWFIPALLSKEECVTFPLFLLLTGARKGRAPVAVMFIAAAAAGARVLWAASATPGSGAGAQAGVTAIEYLAAQGPAILHYARLLVMPWNLAPESPLRIPSWHIALTAWALIATALWFAYRSSHGRWLAGATMMLLPSSSIFPAEDLSADRRLYLPLIAIAAWVACRVRIGPPAMGAVCLLAALSFRQTLAWQDPEVLWRRAVEIVPGKVRPRIQLARSLPPAEAEPVLREAQKLAPDDPRVPSELGKVYLETGRHELALNEFGRALALAPNDPSAINNRGVALWKIGQLDAAKADFRRALALDVCYEDARLNLRRLGEEHEKPAQCR